MAPIPFREAWMTTRRERKPQRVVSATLVAALLATALQGAGAEDAKTLPIVRGGAAEAVIVVGPEASEVVGNAALTLQEEIQRRTGAKLAIQTVEKTGPGLTRIYLGTQDRCQSLGKALGPLAQRPVTADRPGKEGFQLLSGSASGDPVVVVNGCDDLGTFHGVGWLLRRMRFRQAEATLPAGLRLATAPASEMRRIRFGDHCGYVNAELPGWREIWSDYVLWGLSAVTFRCDPAHQGDPRESKLARMLWDKWTERVPLARSLGLEIVHLTQTNLAFKDGEFGPAGIPNFPKINFMCPDFNGVNPKFPEGRAALRASRTWFFDHLPCIEQVNYYLTSGWDGGGCNDPAVAPWSCTYADLVDTIVYPAHRQAQSQGQDHPGLVRCSRCRPVGQEVCRRLEPAVALCGGVRPHPGGVGQAVSAAIQANLLPALDNRSRLLVSDHGSQSLSEAVQERVSAGL